MPVASVPDTTLTKMKKASGQENKQTKNNKKTLKITYRATITIGIQIYLDLLASKYCTKDLTDSRPWDLANISICYSMFLNKFITNNTL